MIALSGAITRSAATMNTSSPSGESPPPMQPWGGAHGDQHHEEQTAEELAHRTGEGGEALGPNHMLTVPISLATKTVGLATLSPVAPNQLHGREPLGYRRGHLAGLVGAGAGMSLETSEQRPDAEEEQWRRGERNECESEGELGQYHERGHDQDQILEEGCQARAHDAFDLVGILHHSRDDLTGAGAFQPIQIEPKQVLEQRGAEIPYQTLLGAHAQLTREVCEAVLGEQRRPQQRNQPQRDAGR